MNEWGNIEGSVEYVKCKSIPRDSKLLDIGCNTGSTIFNLHQYGFTNVYGVDVEKNSINHGKKIYTQISDRLVDYDGVKLPFEDNSFDVVTMFDVIEHITNVDQFIREEVRRVLTGHGILLFQTPNKYTNIPWEIFIHKSLHKYKEYHVSLQSYRSLMSLLENSGFDEIVVEKRNVYTPYYLRELGRYLGPLAHPTLFIANKLPTSCTTNFWGYCRAKNEPKDYVHIA